MRPQVRASLQEEGQAPRQPFLWSFSSSNPITLQHLRNAQQLSPRHLFRDRVLPIAAIESVRLERGEVDAIEASHVHVDLIRVGARNVERMDAAGGAEGVLG